MNLKQENKHILIMNQGLYFRMRSSKAHQGFLSQPLDSNQSRVSKQKIHTLLQ